MRRVQALYAANMRQAVLEINPENAETLLPWLFIDKTVSSSFSDPPTVMKGEDDEGEEQWPSGTAPKKQ